MKYYHCHQVAKACLLVYDSCSLVIQFKHYKIQLTPTLTFLFYLFCFPTFNIFLLRRFKVTMWMKFSYTTMSKRGTRGDGTARPFLRMSLHKLLWVTSVPACIKTERNQRIRSHAGTERVLLRSDIASYPRRIRTVAAPLRRSKCWHGLTVPGVSDTPVLQHL